MSCHPSVCNEAVKPCLTDGRHPSCVPSLYRLIRERVDHRIGISQGPGAKQYRIVDANRRLMCVGEGTRRYRRGNQTWHLSIIAEGHNTVMVKTLCRFAVAQSRATPLPTSARLFGQQVDTAAERAWEALCRRHNPRPQQGHRTRVQHRRRQQPIPSRHPAPAPVIVLRLVRGHGVHQ